MLIAENLAENICFVLNAKPAKHITKKIMIPNIKISVVIDNTEYTINKEFENTPKTSDFKDVLNTIFTILDENIQKKAKEIKLTP